MTKQEYLDALEKCDSPTGLGLLLTEAQNDKELQLKDDYIQVVRKYNQSMATAA